MMDARTAQALEDSIEKWVKNLNAKTWRGVKIDAQDCALCSLFRFQGGVNDCRGCPISEISGARYCDATPYVAACEALDRWAEKSPNRPMPKYVRVAFQAMIDFLKSLRVEAPA